MTKAFAAFVALLIILLAIACSSQREHAPQATLIQATPAPQVDLPKLFSRACTVDLAPRHYDPRVGQFPSSSDLGADLDLLRAQGFSGVATYTASGSLAEIPKLARAAGFDFVVMGVWNPTDADEIQAAIAQADYVNGYLVGNEGLAAGRYTFNDLANAIEHIRNATGRPATTTETPDSFRANSGLWGLGDWVSVNDHPYWAGLRDPAAAARWLGEQYKTLSEEARGHRANAMLVLHEVGWPTDGDPAATERFQQDFLSYAQTEDLTFSYFEAFDSPWKVEHPVEPHWGILREDGSPKPAAAVVCGKQALAVPTETPPPRVPTPTDTPRPPAPEAQVVAELTLGYADFALQDVCTYTNNYCGYADREGKAVIYGSITKQVDVPVGASGVVVKLAVPCDGWGEGVAGSPGSSLQVIVDGDVREEPINSSMPFHHNGHYRYEFCSSFSNTFSIAGKTAITLQVVTTGGARMDFQSAILTFM